MRAIRANTAAGRRDGDVRACWLRSRVMRMSGIVLIATISVLKCRCDRRENCRAASGSSGLALRSWSPVLEQSIVAAVACRWFDRCGSCLPPVASPHRSLSLRRGKAGKSIRLQFRRTADGLAFPIWSIVEPDRVACRPPIRRCDIPHRLSAVPVGRERLCCCGHRRQPSSEPNPSPGHDDRPNRGTHEVCTGSNRRWQA